MSWSLGVSDLRDLARGAALLGTGGGGDPYVGRLLVEQGLAGTGRITMLAPDDLDDDAFVIPVALMGAPTVMVEKLPSGRETLTALRALERRLGRTADAIMPVECGGINSMIPLALATQTGLPVVDADGMGRAFPELQMETFGVYGVSACPMAVSDSDGSTAIIETGRFNPIGTWIGIYFLNTGIFGLELTGVAPWVSDVFYGGVLVIAVTVSTVLHRRST